ncbi:hypothetical protein GW931_01925 [archaeon]|nr:hypothetical protein [archaeon]
MDEYDEEELTLPEEEGETDSKTSLGEERELSKKQKKLLRNQKKFEFNEVEGVKVRKDEEIKEKKKDFLSRWVVGIASLLLLLALYFWLVY